MFNKKNSQNQCYSEIEIINSTRMLSVLSALLFLIFAIVDIWAIPSARSEVFIVRGVVIAFLLTTYLITFSSKFYRYRDYVLSAIFLVASIGVEYMVYRAMPDDHAYSVYFVGLVLILMTLYSWTYVNIFPSLLITIIIVGGYIYIEKFTRPFETQLSTPELAANLFFIGSAVVIGIIARLMRDRFIRENYLLQQSLKDAIKEKTEEANDNAYLANHDALTGLPNRRYITELLETSLEKAKQQNKLLTILFLDLNGFKQVNDIYGHAFGDEVLKIVAKRLELAVRQGDYLSRLGGDEYLISLMLDRESISEVEVLADKFTQLISQPMNIDGVNIKIGVSVGMAAYPIHGNKITVLMDIADKKMYQIKGDKRKPTVKPKNEPVVIFPGKSGRA